MEPTTNTSISINTASVIALFSLLIGGGVTYGVVHFMGKNKISGEQIAYAAAMANVPVCKPEKITPTDDKNLITSLVSYDELTIPRLTTLRGKLTDPKEVAIITDEITRQTDEIKKLKSLYKTEYTQDYTPSQESVYNTPDSYAMDTADTSNYMGIFRGSLEKIQKDFYTYALLSNNQVMKENAQAFIQYKEQVLAKLMTVQ